MFLNRRKVSPKTVASAFETRCGCACIRIPLRMRERKNPRMGIRGRSRSSEIGVTDLRLGGQSWDDVSPYEWPESPSCRFERPPHGVHAPTSRLRRDVFGEQAMRKTGFMATAIWRKAQRAAKVAHVTGAFFRMQTFFLRTDERSSRRALRSVCAVA